MRLRGDKSKSTVARSPHIGKEMMSRAAADHLKTRSTGQGLIEGPNAAIGSADAAQSADDDDDLSSLTESDSESEKALGTNDSVTSQLAGGDDIDQDRPVKRRLILNRTIAAITAPTDVDTDGTPALEDNEDTEDGADEESAEDSKAENEIALDPEAAEDEGSEHLTTNPSQTTPARRGGRRQRGRGGGRKVSPIRGRALTTPKKRIRDDSLAHQSPGGREASSILDRLPGRRRAHHANIDVEVDLRRQLELRVAYRAVAKALKPLLLELADRQAKALQEDEDLHKNCPEYQEILDDLDRRMDKRLAWLQAEHDEEEQRLGRMLRAHKDNIHAEFEQAHTDFRSDALLRCQYDFLQTLRKADCAEQSHDPSTKALPETGGYDLLYSAPNYLMAQDDYHHERRYLTDAYQHWKAFEDRVRLGMAQDLFDPESFARLSQDEALTGDERNEAQEATTLMSLLLAAADVTEGKMAAPKSASPPIDANVGLDMLALAGEMKRASVPTSSLQENHHPSVSGVDHKNRDAAPKVVAESERPPPAAKLRSTPATPRTTRFIPSIASLVNDPESTLSPPRQLTVPSGLSHESARTNELAGTYHKRYSRGSVEPARPTPGPEPRATPAIMGQQHQEVSRFSRNAEYREVLTPRPTNTAAPMHTPLSLIPATEHLQQPADAHAGNEPPKKIRKRPGPRAIYTKQTIPDIAPSGDSFWSPFTNSMGPPTYLPKYVKDADLVRRGSTSNSDSQPLAQEQAFSLPEAMSASPPPPTSAQPALHANHDPPPPSHQSVPPSARGEVQRQQQAADGRRRSAHAQPRSELVPNQQVPLQPAYNWAHQNIYYQPQTFYGPYPPGYQSAQAPPPPHHLTAHAGPPPPTSGASETSHASQRPSWHAERPPLQSRPSHPPAHAPHPSSSRPKDTSGVSDRPERYEAERRQSFTSFPILAPLPPPPPGYHYPGLPPLFHPQYRSEPNRGPIHSNQERRFSPDPKTSRDSYPPPPGPTRRSSHVALVTSVSNPLPPYIHGLPPQIDSRETAPAERSSFQRPPSTVYASESSSRPAIQRQSNSTTSQADQRHSREGQGQGQSEPTSGTSTSTRRSTRSQQPPASASTAQPIQIQQVQHPTFKGQRPKHHEWRNWTSAVPPPSSGASATSSAAASGITAQVNGHSRGSQRKRKAPTSKDGKAADQPAPTGGEQVVVQAPREGQRPGQDGGQREWRFESQNRKFEGA